MIFRLEVSFNVVALIWIIKAYLIVSKRKGTRTSRRQAPQAQAGSVLVDISDINRQVSVKKKRSQMENSGQRSRKLVRSPDSPFTIYGSLVQPNVLGNQRLMTAGNLHVFHQFCMFYMWRPLIKYSSNWFYPEVGS